MERWRIEYMRTDKIDGKIQRCYVNAITEEHARQKFKQKQWNTCIIDIHQVIYES